MHVGESGRMSVSITGWGLKYILINFLDLVKNVQEILNLINRLNSSFLYKNHFQMVGGLRTIQTLVSLDSIHQFKNHVLIFKTSQEKYNLVFHKMFAFIPKELWLLLDRNQLIISNPLFKIININTNFIANLVIFYS